jgi:serine protease Do
LKFADSARLRLGDVVLAVGNPFGVGQTVTMGIVSAKGRANLGIEDYEDFIQTDAAINPGNSGGALINMAGELVGINTAIFSRSGGSMGIGFAIPSNMAQPIANSLVKQGKVIRGWLGVGIQDLSTDLAKALNLPVSNGVVITDIMKDSPAAKAGVVRGDVITAVNGDKVDSTGRLRNLVAAAGANKIQLELLRRGSKLTLPVSLAEAPNDVPSRSDSAKPQDRKEGLTLAPLNDQTRQQFNIGDEVSSGLVIVDVRAGSAAADSGLRPGDVIVEFDNRPLRSVQEFNAAYQQAKDRALLLINRAGGTQFVVLKKK